MVQVMGKWVRPLLLLGIWSFPPPTTQLGSDNASVWTNKGIEVKVRYSALGNSVPTNPVLIRRVRHGVLFGPAAACA